MSRALASLGRFPEAHDAFNNTMALAPANIALHAELGEALVLEAQSTVTPAAEDEFAKAPDDPRSRYYAAEAQVPSCSLGRFGFDCLCRARCPDGAALAYLHQLQALVRQMGAVLLFGVPQLDTADGRGFNLNVDICCRGERDAAARPSLGILAGVMDDNTLPPGNHSRSLSHP
jgi:hypothetical protein